MMYFQFHTLIQELKTQSVTPIITSITEFYHRVFHKVS